MYRRYDILFGFGNDGHALRHGEAAATDLLGRPTNVRQSAGLAGL